MNLEQIEVQAIDPTTSPCISNRCCPVQADWCGRRVGQGAFRRAHFMCRYCAVTRRNWVERDGIGGKRKGSPFVVISREKQAKFAFRMGLLGDYDEGFDSRQLH
jgi:hypothetical protein